MAKYYGRIGFVQIREQAPGVFKEVFDECHYRGDVVRIGRRWDSTDHLNDKLSADVQIKIVADQFAYDNCHLIRYVEWMHTFWEVTNISIERPRLILTLGGIHNGRNNQKKI